VVVLITSQWLLRFILGRFYGVQPLPERELERRSPESVRLLKRVCQQQGISVPPVGLLPGQAPVIMSYGLLPRLSRLVVSQGLLTQLSDDEIAALVGAELGHVRQRDTLPLMVVVVIAQIPFLIYRAVSSWGDRPRNPFLRGIALLVSSTAYGFFWLLRWPGLWLSRTRQFQGDRHAVSFTGNPNGLALALTKTATGMAQDIERQKSTAYVLSGLEMLMPISAQQAIALGSLYGRSQQTPQGQSNPVQFSSLLTWDLRNPYRQWLSIPNSHPVLGDRIKTLDQYTQQFRLRPSIPLASRTTSPSHSSGKSQPFWLQIAPYIGAPVGMGLAIALWLLGGVARMANIDSLEWLWKDMSLLYGCMAMGFSFGTLTRVNPFFPEINLPQAKTEADLPALFQDAKAIPLDSVPVQLEGRLLGRSDTSNGLSQDLMLRTRTGTVKLHCTSPIGPLGNLIIGKTRPQQLIGRSVTITGWFRRGATVWVDVEKIRADGRTLVHSSHPLWSTLLAMAATIWGAYVIYRGTL